MASSRKKAMARFDKWLLRVTLLAVLTVCVWSFLVPKIAKIVDPPLSRPAKPPR